MSTNVTTPMELIERVIEVTGTNRAEAEHLLAACANDVDAAVALYFEQSSAIGNDDDDVVMVSDSIDVDQIENVTEGIVRAPDAPIREQLIHPEDDNFYATAAIATPRLATRIQRVKVCPLRDFAREGALMEAQLQAADGVFGGSPSALSPNDDDEKNSGSRKNARNTSRITSERTELKRKFGLCDLFRPPTDINYAGKFQSARKLAADSKFWLLVNVQSDNFESQLLNRDVWSDKDIRKIISKRYILWQVDAETWEGRRFVAFYHCAKLPYVCIIDPRTGEEVWKCKETKQNNILNDLRDFLQEHKDFNSEEIPTPSKRPKLHKNNGSTDYRSSLSSSSPFTCTSTSTTTTTTTSIAELTKRAKVMELSEEEQMHLAIKNSMRENGHQRKKGNVGDAEDTDDYDDYDDDEAVVDCNDKKKNGKTETEANICDGDMNDERVIPTVIAITPAARTYEEELGISKNELTMLKLRLFNAAGNDEVIQLRWPSDTKLKVLRNYVAEQHRHIPTEGYKIICAFPRKTLEAVQDNSSLKELGLHPSANLHLTLDD